MCPCYVTAVLLLCCCCFTYPHHAIKDSCFRPEDCAIHTGLLPMRQRPPHECHPSWFLNFSTVLLHVSLGRPRPILPLGAHVSAIPKMVPGRVLNTCPIYRQRLTRMRVDTGVLPLLRVDLRCSDGWARISSALSSGMCGETHAVFFRSDAVTLHSSALYRSTESTFEFRMRSLVFWQTFGCSEIC